MTRDLGLIEVPGALPDAACRAWITRAEALGFEAAPIDGRDGPRIETRVRDNDRVVLDDPDAAGELYRAFREWLPAGAFLDLPYDLPGVRRGVAVGLNERLRIYRYAGGQRFRWHTDGSFQRSADEWSAWTVLVYLNDGFEGGETSFMGRDVTPSAGLAVAFPHRLEHSGQPVTRGVKYVLRTDLMVRALDSA